jgi:hypothetical protein
LKIFARCSMLIALETDDLFPTPPSYLIAREI